MSLIHALVESFSSQEPYYLSPAYQESEVRKDFIDKFFIALGWDVNHEEQKNPYKQEVKVERRPGHGTQRRADYAFYVAPNFRDVRFFVEAKKPSRNLNNADDYFQAIRYAWSAGTPIVVLTDFEELHIIDARMKPNIATALDRRLLSFHYSQYTDPDVFAQIYHLLSREAVASGSIEDYVATLPKPSAKGVQGTLFPGSQSIDEAFLEDLDDFRRMIAKAFKKRNQDWDSTLLTEATQRTLDRLVFLRFLEDKLIEPERLVAHFGEKHSIWHDFTTTCKRLNAKYNGIVFKEHFIDAPSCLGPDETMFSDICQNLSSTVSPYDFNTIPIHILGSVYERFLGKVIVATAKRVDVQDKPEVRKAGGVTYTPQHIVRYIVDRTVGSAIAGKTPEQVLAMSFADIACGSGSFLITIFETLLDHAHRWYAEHPKEAKRDGCHTIDGRWVLSLKQKQALLVNSVYGVDLDPQAVEISQLSLYLKLLEDETTATANEMQVLFKEKILPDLSKNIVNGNSIIGTDILDGKFLIEDEERALLPLDFESAFRGVFNLSGGFDAIVGNPPYVRQESMTKKVKAYLSTRYLVAHGVADLYTYFIERGVRLLREGGRFGYIVSNKWMRANYGAPLRAWMKKQHIEEIVDFGDLPVFKTVTTYPCLLFLRRQIPEKRFPVTQVNTLDYDSLEEHLAAHRYQVIQDTLDNAGWALVDETSQKLLDKIRSQGIPLGEYVNGKLFYGIKTGLNEAFIIDTAKKNELIQQDPKSAELIKPYLAGRDVKRYGSLASDKWLIFTRHGINIKQYPAIESHLQVYKSRLIPKPKTWKGGLWKGRKPGAYRWFEIQDTVEYWQEFEKPKFILPDISLRGNIAFDSRGEFYSVNTTYIICSSSLYLLGILNSALMDFIYTKISSAYRGGYIRFFIQYLEILPIIPRSGLTVTNSRMATELDTAVQDMIDSTAKLKNAKSQRDITFYSNKCDALDSRINNLVYKLYDLDEDEIAIIEQHAQRFAH